MALFSICKWPGCGKKIAYGERYCEAHKAKAEAKPRRRRDERSSASSRGYTYRWREYSKRFLKAHPLCEQCKREGRLTPAECVDHIIPAAVRSDLFWDSDNHQALCWACHSKKTAREDGGFGNAKRLAKDKGSP